MNGSIQMLLVLALFHVAFVSTLPVVSTHPIIVIAIPKPNQTLHLSFSNTNISTHDVSRNSSCPPHLHLNGSAHWNQTHAQFSNSTSAKHPPCLLPYRKASATPLSKNVTLPTNTTLTSHDVKNMKSPTNTTEPIDSSVQNSETDTASETETNTEQQNGDNSEQLNEQQNGVKPDQPKGRVDVFNLRPHPNVAQLLQNDRGDDESDHNDGGEALLWAPAGFLVFSSATIVLVVFWRRRSEKK